MKICTDACLFGAWTAQKVKQLYSTNKILDIGCGTGLLSLMLAQQTHAGIDAIEIDPAAATQAKENISNSPWKERIEIINISLEKFNNNEYDFIICNPPFYEADLKSPDENINASRHSTTLKFDEMINYIRKNLREDGSAAALIPFERTAYFSMLLEKNKLWAREEISVRHSPAHPYSRSILWFSASKPVKTVTSELVINNNDDYSSSFKELLSPYYLNL